MGESCRDSSLCGKSGARRRIDETPVAAILTPVDASAQTIANISLGLICFVVLVLRRLEIQSESFMNYLYNPF